MGIGNYWMSQMNLDISSWQVVWPRCVVIGRLSMIFAPLNVAGSVGTSVAQTIHAPRPIRGRAPFLVLLMKPSVAAKGAHVAAEQVAIRTA